MARGRMLNRKISRDKRVAELVEAEGVGAALLFTWLLAHLDREGRHDGDPAVVKGAVVPRLACITEADVERQLAAMHAAGLLDWYEVDGDRYISLPRFADNQIGLRKKREPESEIPPPPADIRQPSGNDPAKCRQPSGNDPAEGKGIEGKEIEGKEREQIAAAAAGTAIALPGGGPGDVAAAIVHDVWIRYRHWHPRARRRLTSKAKEYRMIKARLDEGFDPDQLKEAIDGYHRSPFHQGENDRGRKYLGIDLICRDGPHVQQGIEMAVDPDTEQRAADNNSALRRSTNKLARWANEPDIPGDPKAAVFGADGALAGLLPRKNR